MRLFILIIGLVICSSGINGDCFAQIQDPVKWSFSVEQNSAEEATIIMKATMDKGWHIYPQKHTGETGLATEFTFTKNAKNYEKSGKAIEPVPHSEYDTINKVSENIHEGTVIFKQKIKLICKAKFEIKGSVFYQTCNNGMCLAPTDVPFTCIINKDSKEEACTGEQTSSQDTATIAVDTITAAAVPPAPVATDTNKLARSADLNILEKECSEGIDEAYESQSLWGIFILSFLGGLLALLTPCVFPMIPMTVSFFTKRSKTRSKGISNAIIYAVSIIVIYVALGMLVTIIAGPSALNEMASSVFFNLLFFVVFVVFALSFFGAFEIVLPSSWVNKADSKSDRGGLIGIFFMAFTLSLVSFSCTGPIIGTLLAQAAQTGALLGPTIGMFGFSLALALPFALFAMFPGWLNSLPKSGGWLNSVKVCLGFLELALALKFLSNVDLAYHWGILQRELFIALWIIIFGLLGLYLIGKLKFSHDSDLPYISTPRLIFAILSFTFTMYLVPGLWGAPLKIISGFPPPDFYKEWNTNSHGCPHNLNCFHDYEEGMAYAKAEGKPVMVDFTGWSCVNCRKMEDNVWSDAKILKKLSEKYVLISLYVDDKEVLEGGAVKSPFSDKTISTTGGKWSDMQTQWYGSNSQPYYVLLDHNERILAAPRGYTPDKNEYSKFLDEGLCRFKLRSVE
ncbi:MAG: thioredoxin family protein [Bacteroidetes bacterium]|nr:thioredoxin family protein [Bacteroidota bacterium]